MGEHDEEMEFEDDSQDSEAKSGTRSSGLSNREESVEYWRSKYSGLQGHTKKLQTRYAKLKQDYDALSEESEATVASLTAERDTISKTYNDLLAQFEQVSEEKTRLEKRINTSQKIRSQFPDLADLYDEGLLRVDDLDGDALDEYLTKYAERLGQIGQRQRQKEDEEREEDERGGTPNPPPGKKNGGETLEEVRDSLPEYLKKYGVNGKEYRDRMNLYTNLLIQSRQGDR